jgi:hypothetical protein
MATTQTNSASGSQLSDTLNATLTNAGTATQNGLNVVALVHQARLAQKQRYAAALEKEYGAQDAGTLAAQARVATTKLVIAKVNVAQQQASTPSLTLSADEWALQGRVYDANSNPLAALTVFLVDGQKIWLRQNGFSYTDQTGYFVLKGTSSTEAKAGAMYIEIASDKGLPIFLDSASFTPVNGQAVYKSITLASQTPIGDPPCSIRELGIPPQGNEYANPEGASQQS